MSDTRNGFFGKFRGTVQNNIDPMRMGRVQLMVPDVPSFVPTTWAMPCVPLAGVQSGILAVPAIGSSIWVEFERGEVGNPVWVGGFWPTAADLPQRPSGPGLANCILIQTPMGHSITISDTLGETDGIVLQSPDGSSIRIGRSGILITNGKGASIRLDGPTVDINSGALAIT